MLACKDMDRNLQVFQSFEDADRAEADYYTSLRPTERVDILLDLVANYRKGLGEAAERFERVCRVVELSQS